MKLNMVAAALAAALVSGTTLACTTVLVGSEATSDGSVFIARSVDSSALNPSLLIMHPAAVNKTGAVYRGSDNSKKETFEYPLPKKSLGYSTGPDWDSMRYGGCGFNDAGLGVSATESIYARDDVLKLDPHTKLGIKERDITDVILAQAKTAREAVKLLGRIVETQGAGESLWIKTRPGTLRRVPATSGLRSAFPKTSTSLQETRDGCNPTIPRTLTSWPPRPL